MGDDDNPLHSDRRTTPTRGRISRSRRASGLPGEGEVVDGKYRVERVLGAGGMGVVVAAMHLDLGERVALKFVKVTEPDDDVVERLRREARITFRLRSQHVARLLDVGTLESGTPFLVLEHLVGKDLARVIDERGPVPIAEAVDWVIQASVAIAEAHRLGIIHRDLKPSNVFLTSGPDGASLVKVLDFGVAKALGQLSGAGDAITTTSAVVGSPLYMSPEQVRGARNVDHRSDIWSLGVILHELVTGAPPFQRGPASAVCAAIAADSPARLRAGRADAPAALEALVLKCLEKDTSKRFQTVGAFATALGRFAPASSAGSLRDIAALARDVSYVAFATTNNDEPTEPSIARGRSAGRAALSALGVVLAGIVGVLVFGPGGTEAARLPATRNVRAAFTRPLEKSAADNQEHRDEPGSVDNNAVAETSTVAGASGSKRPERGQAAATAPNTRVSVRAQPATVAAPSASGSAAPAPPPIAGDDLELRATSRRH